MLVGGDNGDVENTASPEKGVCVVCVRVCECVYVCCVVEGRRKIYGR